MFRRSGSLVSFVALVPLVGCDAGVMAPDPSNPPAPVWREAFDPGDAGFLSSAWGSAPDDVFIVGGQPERAAVFHYDGRDWKAMAVPEVPVLIWVFGFAANDVFAVGEQGTALHYDGVSWEKMTTGTSIDLFGVWGASRDNLWAVGGEVATGPPIIMRYDGAAWTEVPVPLLDRTSTALLKVWGTSATQIFAVGQTGVIIEFDGTAWQQVGSGTSEDIVSLWGTAPDRIVAVGGRSNGAVLFYDGANWTPQDVGPIAGLNGVFVTDQDEAVVAGILGRGGVFDIARRELTFEITPTATSLHAVWSDGAGTTYIVGGGTAAVPYTGVALTRTVE